jgi:tetratricopeptide (TPR) repeat protein
MRTMIKFVFLALLLPLVAVAGPVERGAEAWERGQIAEAISYWQPVADEGGASGRIYYNLGCAWYRLGDRPRALAYWRAAQLIWPWSGDVNHNLALARSELPDYVPEPVGAPKWWMEAITSGQLGVLGLAVLALASAIAVRWRRKRGGSAAMWLLLALVGLLLSVAAMSGLGALKSSPVGVVVDGVARVRDAPHAAAGELFLLAPGAEVQLIRHHGGFVLIRTGESKRGWLPRQAALVVGPGARP